MNKKIRLIAFAVTAVALLAGCKKEPPVRVVELTPTETTAPSESIQMEIPVLTPQYEYEEPEATYENGSAYVAFGSPFRFDRETESAVVDFEVNIPNDEQIFKDERESDIHIILSDNREMLIGYLPSDSSDSLENVYPALLDIIKTTLANGVVSENDIVIETSGIKDVNGIEMARVQLRLTVYNHHGRDSAKWKIVGYAAELESGGYAYFLIGGTTGNSRFIAIRQAAENMAFTFKEATE